MVQDFALMLRGYGAQAERGVPPLTLLNRSLASLRVIRQQPGKIRPYL
jgi:hypothetical protein